MRLTWLLPRDEGPCATTRSSRKAVSAADDSVVAAGFLVRTGGNIIGADIFSGDMDVGDTTAAAVFDATTEIAPGVLAGVLAHNEGPAQTIALTRPDEPGYLRRGSGDGSGD